MRLHPPTPQTRKDRQTNISLVPVYCTRTYTAYTGTKWYTMYDGLLYLGTIKSTVLLYLPEEKFPSVHFCAQPLVSLGGVFCRRSGGTGPAGGASTIHLYLPRCLELQWIPRFKSAQDKSTRDSRAVKLACPAYAKRYIFSLQMRAMCS